MKMLTVFIPEKYIEYLDLFVLEDRFPNRSEAIRIAIRDLIRNEILLKKIVDKEKERNEFKKILSQENINDIENIEV